MIARTDLERTARAHLRDARILHRRGSHDGAVYLCGYAIEIALKARICRTLKWTGFPSTGGEFLHARCLQTHNFEALLLFSGMEARIKPSLVTEWAVAVAKWSPEQRYNPVGTKTKADAVERIDVAQALLKVIL